MFNVSENPVATANKNALMKARDLTEVLEILTHEAQGQLGSVTQTAFFIGDGLQRAITNGIFDAFLPQTWSPGNILRLGSALVGESVRLSKLLSPAQAQLAWQELKNKAEVFALVKNLSSVLKLSKGEFIPLSDLVEKAYSLSPYAALWAVEGVGHYYADDHWARHGQPDGLLAETNTQVPAKSLLMLHAGMGLCFADQLVGDLTTESTPDEVRAALEQFVMLCSRNSRTGYLSAAIESLGIVTRDFHPELFAIISEQFQVVAPEFAGFYWHGIGRAIYFSRKFFVPRLFSMWSDVNAEATTEPERMSAMAGLTWAFTLVNMRQPAIVETALRAYSGDSARAEAFSNGVSSCVIMRSDTTPEEPFVSAFYQYQPGSRDSELVSTWEQRVSQPAQTGVNSYYPVLQQHQALDQVFRYQDLAQLVQQLEASCAGISGEAKLPDGCGCCEMS